jgi:hypothetical protein
MVFTCVTDAGIDYWVCGSCGAVCHPPLKFLGSQRTGSVPDGDLFRPDFFGITEMRADEPLPRRYEKPPVMRNPVPLAFYPALAMSRDDASEHEGVSFRMLWGDAVARTLWLGYKPFILTSQYFRGSCMKEAERLREFPERLLREGTYVPAIECALGGNGEFATSISAQIIPHLIYELTREGRWPFFHLGGIGPLRWRSEVSRDAY